MDVTNLAALATSMANQRTGDAIAVSVLKKAIDTEAAAAAALINALPPVQAPNLPPNLGRLSTLHFILQRELHLPSRIPIILVFKP